MLQETQFVDLSDEDLSKDILVNYKEGSAQSLFIDLDSDVLRVSFTLEDLEYLVDLMKQTPHNDQLELKVTT